jgi:nicotinamide mononucleotide transporter
MAVLCTLWGYNVTLIEFASVITAFLAIGLCIKGTRWGWPFYFLSSLLYGWLFLEIHLYALAAAQLIFMGAAVWGWFTWGQEGVQAPSNLTPQFRIAGGLGTLALTALIVPILKSIGGAAPWGDAYMLVGSLAGQLLMVRQKVESWPVWLTVNAVGTALFASQGFYFTALFYALLLMMSVTGWRTWSSRSAAPSSEPYAAHT